MNENSRATEQNLLVRAHSGHCFDNRGSYEVTLFVPWNHDTTSVQVDLAALVCDGLNQSFDTLLRSRADQRSSEKGLLDWVLWRRKCRKNPYKSAPCSKPPLTLSPLARSTISGIQDLKRRGSEINISALFSSADGENKLGSANHDRCAEFQGSAKWTLEQDPKGTLTNRDSHAPLTSCSECGSDN